MINKILLTFLAKYTPPNRLMGHLWLLNRYVRQPQVTMWRG